jgi:hypothetical protein
MLRARAWEWDKDPLFARGGQGSRKISYNINFKLVLLNQYLDKNTLKAILIWQGLYVLHFRYETIILLEITKKYIKREVA